jgi:hypothetical protein
MGKYGPDIGPNIGNASRMPSANGAHNFQRTYFKSTSTSGDVRAHYEDLYFNSTGGGETIRVRGIANTASSATGATINAIHATGRVAAGKTVSGALNAIRATLEVAGTTPTPGGTLAALQLDSNISTGWTAGNNDAFIRVGNTGAGLVGNLLNITDAAASQSATALFTSFKTATQVGKFGIKIRVNGADRWILCTDTAPTA